MDTGTRRGNGKTRGSCTARPWRGAGRAIDLHGPPAAARVEVGIAEGPRAVLDDRKGREAFRELDNYCTCFAAGGAPPHRIGPGPVPPPIACSSSPATFAC